MGRNDKAHILLTWMVVATANIIVGAPAVAQRPSTPFRAYATTATLMCDGKQIIITTNCLDDGSKDFSRPYCYRQDVAFASARDQVAAATYVYTYDDERSHLFVQAGCVSPTMTPKKGLVVLRGTNFAECARCEWEDVYTSEGAYLGSTPEDDEYTTSGSHPEVRTTGSTIRHGSLALAVRRAVERSPWQAMIDIPYVAPHDRAPLHP